MDKISVFEIIIFTVILVVTGFSSVVRSAQSLKETHQEEQSQALSFFTVVFGALMGLTFKVMPPAVYAGILVVITGLHLLNREGSMRRQSWNLLAAGYAFILIVSVVYHRKDNVFHPLMLLWLIPVVAPFIAGWIQTIRLNKKTNKTELSGRIFYGAITAILTVAVIVLFVLVLTKK